MKTAIQLLGKATVGCSRLGTIPKAAAQGLSHSQEVGQRVWVTAQAERILNTLGYDRTEDSSRWLISPIRVFLSWAPKEVVRPSSPATGSVFTYCHDLEDAQKGPNCRLAEL